MGKRGYIFLPGGFNKVIEELSKSYRIYAPVLKVGEGRFTDTDVVRYDFVKEASEIELDKKSDYSFKEILTPLSQTLFFFTENDVKESEIDEREVLIFLRSCDLNALKRLDQIYLQEHYLLTDSETDCLYNPLKNCNPNHLHGLCPYLHRNSPHMNEHNP